MRARAHTHTPRQRERESERDGGGERERESVCVRERERGGTLGHCSKVDREVLRNLKLEGMVQEWKEIGCNWGLHQGFKTLTLF